MEYVQGESLADLIKAWSGPLPLEIFLDITIGLVEALEVAHQQGFVHRDIKPANVMIQKDGVKLTDFGIASLTSLLTEGSDYIVGTPAYISPEQIEGLPLDGRADLYSLGVMLFEMASGGDRPFMNNSQTDLFMAHLEEAPPHLKTFSPDTPLALERTIVRLLEKNPEDRFASAAELFSVLKNIRAREKFSQPHLQLLDADTRPLIGRQGEVNQLNSAWETVQEAARPHLLVVQGQAGSGKTKLITDFLGQTIVDLGSVALAGHCHEAGLPYAPFAEILETIFNRNLTTSPPAQKTIDHLIEQIPSLARLLNITETETGSALTTHPKKKRTTVGGGLWQALTERVPENTSRDFSDTQWQFSKTILDILSDLGPTAIFLEDATYLDEASAALIRFLIRQGQLPLLFITACRDRDDTPAWLKTFSNTEKSALPLPALQTAAIECYLVDLIDGSISPEVVALVEERSQGIPVNIEEMAWRLIETKEIEQADDGVWRPSQTEQVVDAFLPKSVLGAFKRQIDKLNSSSRQALALAALIEPGSEFDLELWLALLANEMPEVSGQDVLDDALKKRLLRKISETRYAFRPPDVAKALIATLTGTHRLDLHTRIAGILDQEGADPLLVGHHYERSGEIGRAAHYLESAGGQAISTKALSVALTYYNRAATLTGSRSAYRTVGHLQRQQGNHSEAIAAYKQTLALAREAGDITDEAKTLNSLALTLCLNDQYQAAHRQAEQILQIDSVSVTVRAIAQSHLGLILWLSGRLAEAETWCQQAVKNLAARDNQADLGEAYYRLGLIHTSQGKFDKARLVLQQALQIHRKAGDKLGEAYCLNGLGRLVAERGDFEQGLSLLSTAQDLFKKNGGRDGLVVVFANRGRILCDQNQPTQAMPFLTKALEIAKDIGERSAHIIGDIYLLIARSSLMRKKYELAQSATNDALQLVESIGNLETTAQAQSLLAQINAEQNDLSAAETMYTTALNQFKKIGCRPGLTRTQYYYAQFLRHHLGQLAEAIPFQLEAREAAKQMGLFIPNQDQN